jgi:transporter family-2 protein
MLKNDLFLGLLAALGAGALIAVQTAYLSRAGASVGAIRSAMLTTLVGAILAGAVLLALWLRGGLTWRWDAQTWTALVVAAVLGVTALSGLAFASGRTGVTASLATILLGQMALSVFLDARGASSAGVIAVTWERVLGLGVLAVAIYLILPRS